MEKQLNDLTLKVLSKLEDIQDRITDYYVHSSKLYQEIMQNNYDMEKRKLWK